MADKTLGIKVSEEMHDRAKAVIEMSGLTAKDWLEKAVALYELNSLKDGISGDFSNDLAELEVHTTRIYALISNMVARSAHLKDHAVKEVTAKLESKEEIVGGLQREKKILQEMALNLEKEKNEAVLLNVALEEQVTSLQNSLDNDQALINEYKEKIDTLSGLVAKQQKYVKENEELKDELKQTRALFDSEYSRLEKRKEVLDKKVHELEKEERRVEIQYENETKMLIEKKDLERERAVLAVEREYQDKLAASNEKIRELYDEMATLRAAHDEQMAALKDK